MTPNCEGIRLCDDKKHNDEPIIWELGFYARDTFMNPIGLNIMQNELVQ